LGALATRSLLAIAVRVPASMPATPGAVTRTRSANSPQVGQAVGALYSLIGRLAVKVPHSLQL
jgi:hypothetical protein